MAHTLSYAPVSSNRTAIFTMGEREVRQPTAVVIANIGGGSATVTLEWERFGQGTFTIATGKIIPTTDTQEIDLRSFLTRPNDILYITVSGTSNVFVLLEDPLERQTDER